MKSKIKIRLMSVVLGAVAIIIAFVVVSMIDTSKTRTVHAATAPYNDSNSVNGVRIDGWQEFQNMETYGRNNDNGCGFTAMAILLQYYNDFTISSGEILPDLLDYQHDSGIGGNNNRANALRQDLFDRTPRFLGGLGSAIDSWFNNIQVGNATIHLNQRDGLNSFFNANSLNINAESADVDIAPSYPLAMAMNKIENNIPVIMTILSYKYSDASSSGSGTFFGGDAHTIVVYGYREINNEIQFLAHSG